MTVVALILQILQLAGTSIAGLVSTDKTAAEIDLAAQSLIQIVQAAMAAHQAITGQPIDLTQLQPIDPVA